RLITVMAITFLRFRPDVGQKNADRRTSDGDRRRAPRRGDCILSPRHQPSIPLPRVMTKSGLRRGSTEISILDQTLTLIGQDDEARSRGSFDAGEGREGLRQAQLKNDAADAEAICEAVRRPTMRFVGAKSAEQ